MNMTRMFLSFFLTLILLCGIAHAIEPVRTWTASDGRTLEARMLSSQADTVTIMNTTGQTFVIPFSKLSEADVAYIKSTTSKASAPKHKGGWLEDFESAKEIAASEDKPILMLFTGSDWCPYCVKLEKNVLKEKEFKSYADEELVLMMVDFPRRKKQKRSLAEANKKLNQQYGIRGYPTLVLVDEKGKALSTFGYGGQDAEKFVESLKTKVK